MAYKKYYKKKGKKQTTTVAALTKKVNAMLKPEKKMFDVSTVDSVDSNGRVFSLSSIAAGSADNQRTGNQVKAQTLSFHGSLYYTRTGTGTSYADNVTANVTHIFLVRDNQQIADTLPAFNQIFDLWYGNPQIARAALGRFTILHSETIKMDTITGPAHIPIIFNKKLNHVIRYNSTGTSDIQKNGLYLVAVNWCSAGVDRLPNLILQSRLWYTDD